jgi:hypothetical protein
MPPKDNETPAGSYAEVPWNSLDGTSAELFSPTEQFQQAIPDLIALHIGAAEIARWAEGGAP